MYLVEVAMKEHVKGARQLYAQAMADTLHVEAANVESKKRFWQELEAQLGESPNNSFEKK